MDGVAAFYWLRRDKIMKVHVVEIVIHKLVDGMFDCRSE